ncbi:sigma-E processing peptidase SpoIIGA [Sporolituus thermophilus]|uniref:Sporulation sigma-E factor-processing peptidase n=1 Tax=Sporolituus thermophilus DSM 23256 TaxID=1123285 RepID=A0A1G7I3R0_9FIRM|nr:sigma-E processing peptidase SpoIIGA [Sporolituus thermophilus]SDF06979.1 stage II sporulation protein GA (sporulation sigma-E factor processing peptidase) [Sporolituus thermophilus DSM 23256]
MYIYADVVIALNLIMNSLILWLTAWAAGVRYRWWRVILAASVGGLYSLIGIYQEFYLLYTPLAKLLISILLIIFSFGWQSLRLLFLLVGLFYLVSFLLGGAVVGWLFFSQATWLSGWQIAWYHLALGSLVGTGMAVLLLRYVLQRRRQQRHLYSIEVEYGGRKVSLTALLDTGNGLFSPLSRRPVIIMDCSKVMSLLSPEAAAFLRTYAPNEWLTELTYCSDTGWLERVEVIPYRAVSGMSMLLSFRPDSVTVRTGEGTTRASGVLIGIYGGRLSADDKYSALLHPAVLDKGVNDREASICA